MISFLVIGFYMAVIGLLIGVFCTDKKEGLSVSEKKIGIVVLLIFALVFSKNTFDFLIFILFGGVMYVSIYYGEKWSIQFKKETDLIQKILNCNGLLFKELNKIKENPNEIKKETIYKIVEEIEYIFYLIGDKQGVNMCKETKKYIESNSFDTFEIIIYLSNIVNYVENKNATYKKKDVIPAK
ncbi:MAG: hypothetical protein N2043_02030 [Ignavibacterium sp.]|nr:hypothetical protein [Ignavibacterium sp.]